MSASPSSGSSVNMPDTYEIIVAGSLDPNWSDWLAGFAITPLENGDTLISGAVVDQSALHGLLARIRDLNLKLISVKKQGIRLAKQPVAQAQE